MKALNVVAAFLGGLALGAAAGVLFAPEKGEDTRSKIAELLRKKGIRLNREEMDDFAWNSQQKALKAIEEGYWFF